MCDLLKFNLGPRWGLPIDKENDKKILYSSSTISAILSLEVTNTENQKKKQNKRRLLGSFSFPCASIVTLLNDAVQLQRKLVSQGCTLEQGGEYG
jgi:hypothetical protein